jgi:outer membrane protein OmpA-like peptidoglycan-associated protein
MTNPIRINRKNRSKPGNLSLIAMSIAVLFLLMPLAAKAQSGQLTVGVLPFADNTGSSAADVADSVSRAVQAEIVHSTQLLGRVLTLDAGASHGNIDPGMAIMAGRAQGVDVVVVGTVLEATSEQSSKSASLPSFGGISLGGNKVSIKATVTLQADLFNTSNGQKIDSIRQTGNASQSKVGTDVSTGLGGLNSGGANFDNSAIGKAFHSAVSALVQKINGDQAQMTHYSADSGAGATAAAPAMAGASAPAASSSQAASSAASAAPAASTTAFKVYQNYDFSPGDTIIFADDFTETQDGEFPERWELKSGQAVVNTNNGNPAFYLTDGNYVRVAPRMKTPSYLGDQYTIELDWMQAHAYGLAVFLGGYGGSGGTVTLNQSSADYSGPSDHSLSAKMPSSFDGDDFHNAWHHVGIAVKGTQLKVYVDQYRVLVVPDSGISVKNLELGGIGSQDHPLIFTNFRLASGGGMNMIGQKFTDAKIVTHGINFDVDKATLRPESMGTLNQIKRILTQNPDLKFEIDGHTDNSGAAAHNLALSQQRADAVKDQLVSMGIDAGRLTTKGFGDTKPIASNATPDGKANNRRVEFVRMK